MFSTRELSHPALLRVGAGRLLPLIQVLGHSRWIELNYRSRGESSGLGHRKRKKQSTKKHKICPFSDGLRTLADTQTTENRKRNAKSRAEQLLFGMTWRRNITPVRSRSDDNDELTELDQRHTVNGSKAII